MYPELFRIGDFVVTSFGLMMFLSFVAAASITGKMLLRYGLPAELAWDVLAWVAIGGILGAKLYYLGLHIDDVLADPRSELFSRGGLVWYGGLIGGILAYYWQVRSRKLPVATMFDATAPGLALGYAIGRLGCFLVGDDYGVYTDSWVGIAFPNGAPPSTAGNLRERGSEVPASFADSAVVTVHPTQLYEIGLALIIFTIVWRLGRRAGLHAGQLFALFLALYSVERFMIEFVRAKDDRVLGILSTSHIASIILFVVALGLWWRQRSAPIPPLPTASGRPGRPGRQPTSAR